MSQPQPQSALPHLPQGMAIPQVQISASTEPMMPGQKMITGGEEEEEEGPLSPQQEQQLVPQPQPQYRRPTQGIPMNERASQQQQLVAMNPPPMFSAQPKRIPSLRRSSPGIHKDVHRLESGIDPVGVMSNRLEAWRFAIKDMVAVFKKVAEVEEQSAKGWVSAGRNINVPFRGSNGQFLQSGGIQDVWTTVRNYANEHSILHRQFATYVRDTLIPSLRAVKSDTKKMLSSIQNDKQLKSTEIFENRMKLDKNIAKLEKNIQAVDRSPLAASQCCDPFLVNLAVIHAIRELCDHENRLHDTALALQKEVGVFEQKIIETCRYIMQHLQNFRLEHKMEGIENIGLILQTFDTIQPFTEWNDFIARNQYSLVMENSAYKTEDAVKYPNQQHAYVRASKIGQLSTKQGGLSKSWVEGICVVTPAGFLHCYKTPQYFQARATEPTFSIYIPDTIITPDKGRQASFTIKLKNTNKKANGIRLSSLNVSTSFTFLARTMEESYDWQQTLGAISSRHEVVPLMVVDRPVPAHQQHRNLPAMPAHVLPQEQQEETTSDGAFEQDVPSTTAHFNQAPPTEVSPQVSHTSLPEQEPTQVSPVVAPVQKAVDTTGMDPATAASYDALQNPSISPYDILNMARDGMGNSSVPASGAYADPGLFDEADAVSWDQNEEEQEGEALTHEIEQEATPSEEVIPSQEDTSIVSHEEMTHEIEQEAIPSEEVIPSQEELTHEAHLEISPSEQEEAVLSDEELTHEIHQLINPSVQVTESSLAYSDDDASDVDSMEDGYNPATIAMQEANKLGSNLDHQQEAPSMNAMDNEKRVQHSV